MNTGGLWPLLFFLVLLGAAALRLRPALHRGPDQTQIGTDDCPARGNRDFPRQRDQHSGETDFPRGIGVVGPLAVFGLQGWWPMLQRVRRETIIAVNVGGCLIPEALAIYETAHLVMAGGQALFGLLLAVVINTGVRY